jgi:hypothetical protein
MVELVTTSAGIRISGEDKRSVFSATNILPTVSAETVAGFVSAVEKLYNNSTCSARINIVLNLKR